jgi:hypothetical protein
MVPKLNMMMIEYFLKAFLRPLPNDIVEELIEINAKLGDLDSLKIMLNQIDVDFYFRNIMNHPMSCYDYIVFAPRTCA